MGLQDRGYINRVDNPFRIKQNLPDKAEERLNVLMNQPVHSKADEVIRKWFLTICHDLCIVPPKVGIAKQLPSMYGGKTLGIAVLNKARSVFLSTKYPSTERNLLHTLAHELRHIFNADNRRPQTEQDCDDYADGFCKRFQVPNGGRFYGRLYKYERICQCEIATIIVARISVLIVVAGPLCIICGLYSLIWGDMRFEQFISWICKGFWMFVSSIGTLFFARFVIWVRSKGWI